MNSSDALEIEELSEPEFTDHADIAFLVLSGGIMVSITFN